MLNKHKRWFNSSRVKFPFVSLSASWFLVSMYLIWILGSKLILSNNQSRATNSVGSGNMSHGRASSLNDHFDHCFIVFKDIQQNFLTRRIRTFGENTINIVQIINLSMKLYFALEVCAGWHELSSCTGLSVLWLFWYVFSWRTATIGSHKSSAGIPSNLNPASKEMISDSVELCETKVCFLHIQLIGTKRMTSENAQCSTWCTFWILKISCKVGVLNQSQSALFCSVSHMTILFVITCMMNVWNETR